MRLLFLFILFPCLLIGQSPQPIANFIFQPDYQLFGNAANSPGPRIENPKTMFSDIEIEHQPIRYKGHLSAIPLEIF